MTEDQKKSFLLFDFDGTLADTLSIVIKIVNDIGPQYKLREINEIELQRIRMMSGRELIKYSGMPLRKIPFFIRRVQTELKHRIKEIKPFQDIPGVLKSLSKSGYNMDILTSNLKNNVEEFLEMNNLTYFEDIYVCGNIFGKKHELEKFIKDKKLNGEDVIYFGDEIRDIEAAKSAGVKVAAVTWGYNDENSLKQNNPDFLINHPRDILRLVNIFEK